MSSQIYQVESILDYRFHKGTLQYQVKWKDYDVEESTWEPFNNLNDCKEVIEKFKKERGLDFQQEEEVPVKAPVQRIRKRILQDDERYLPSDEEEDIAVKRRTQKRVVAFTNEKITPNKTIRKEPLRKPIVFQENYENKTKQDQQDKWLSDTDFLEQQELPEEEIILPIVVTALMGDSQKNIYFQVKRGREYLTMSRAEVIRTDVKALLAFYQAHIQWKNPQKK